MTQECNEAKAEQADIWDLSGNALDFTNYTYRGERCVQPLPVPQNLHQTFLKAVKVFNWVILTTARKYGRPRGGGYRLH